MLGEGELGGCRQGERVVVGETYRGGAFVGGGGGVRGVVGGVMGWELGGGGLGRL